MVQGFGFALLENLAAENGKILANNLSEYKLPNIRDVPRHETLYVRDDEGPGPFLKPSPSANMAPFLLLQPLETRCMTPSVFKLWICPLPPKRSTARCKRKNVIKIVESILGGIE